MKLAHVTEEDYTVVLMQGSGNVRGGGNPVLTRAGGRN